jgi:amidophosphoribosyltransferase
MDGIAAVYSPGDSNLMENIFNATGSLQHRGKDGAGVCVGNKNNLYVHRDLGRIGNVLNGDLLDMMQGLGPVAAIGDVGYTKNRIAEKNNAEPLEVSPKGNTRYHISVAMDGCLINSDELRAELQDDYHFRTRNETEVVGALLHKYISKEGINFSAGKKLVDKLHGRATFALVALVNDGKETYMVTLNDDRAFEPFCYGNIGNSFVVSSESCSHTRLAGDIKREFDGAEMAICSSNGIEMQRVREESMLPDVFQAVYFGHPASLFGDVENFSIRTELGRGLFKIYGESSADIVIPNPDSGWGVTMGLFEAYRDSLMDNAFDLSDTDNITIRDHKAFERFIGLTTVYPALIKQAQAVRTFQEAARRVRANEVGLKFGGIESLLRGKNVAMGDDSIVKGSVSEGGSVWVAHNAGIKKLEFWISYAPMMFPSFKEWHRGEKCIRELAVQRAFENETPYGKSID